MNTNIDVKEVTAAGHFIWGDTCRIVAIILVVLIHSSAPIFYTYGIISTKLFLGVNLLDSFSRVAVPLFILLSGALLLNTGKDLILIKRVSRVAVPLFCWSVFYAIILSYNGAGSFWSLFKNIFYGPIMFHLGFVYMIIGVYLALPFSRTIYNSLIVNSNWAIYFFALWFLINSVTIYYPIPLVSSLQLSNCLNYTGLFMLGGYLSKAEIQNRIKVPAAFLTYILASLSTFFLTWYFTAKTKVPTETAYQYLSPNVVISAAALFVIFPKITIPQCFHKTLMYLSPLVFPVYLMHPFVMSLLRNGFFSFSITPYTFYPGIGVFLLAITTLIISFGLASLTRLIPFSEKFIG